MRFFFISICVNTEHCMRNIWNLLTCLWLCKKMLCSQFRLNILYPQSNCNYLQTFNRLLYLTTSQMWHSAENGNVGSWFVFVCLFVYFDLLSIINTLASNNSCLLFAFYCMDFPFRIGNGLWKMWAMLLYYAFRNELTISLSHDFRNDAVEGNRCFDVLIAMQFIGALCSNQW